MKKLSFGNILTILLVLLVLIQLIPAARNNGEVKGPDHLSTIITVPEDINNILQNSCNDCHSNHTEYPWYSRIQPVGFWLEHHVNEGKQELNFSEFATYSPKRQRHKLDEIIEMTEEHEMPISSYTLIHTDSKLSADQETALIEWAKEAKTFIRDSVVAP